MRLLVLLALCACGRQSRPPASPKPTLTPQLALETIEKRYVGGMQRCYRARLKHDATAAGNVVVTFTVDGHGQVTQRSARGIGTSVERCVEDAMRRWTFPRPAAETTFRLAFRLSSRS